MTPELQVLAEHYTKEVLAEHYTKEQRESPWWPSLSETEYLENLIVHHNYCYFVLNKPEIDDYEFDRLTIRLKELKPDSEVLKHIGFKPVTRSKEEILRYTLYRVGLEEVLKGAI